MASTEVCVTMAPHLNANTTRESASGTQADKNTSLADAGNAALRIHQPGEAVAAQPQRIALGATGTPRDLIACSETLRQLIDKAKQVARSQVSVLIQGASGTGKELLARLIHES